MTVAVVRRMVVLGVRQDARRGFVRRRTTLLNRVLHALPLLGSQCFPRKRLDTRHDVQSNRSSFLALLQMMLRMSASGTPSKSRLMMACDFGKVVSECG